jgi:hypothetical protein
MADETPKQPRTNLRLEDLPEEMRELTLAEAEQTAGGLVGGIRGGGRGRDYTLTEPKDINDIYRIDD